MTPLVLVHGGAHGGWCWEPTERVLRADAVAVDLPPASVRGGPGRHEFPPGSEDIRIADWSAAVIDAADAHRFERFVLVGHSLGGLTICDVARRVPDRVAHLVFVSALVPPEGGNAIDAMAPEFIDNVATGLTDDLVREMFCNDFDAAQTRFELDHIGTDVAAVMTEPVTRAGIEGSLPKTYIRLARDQGLPPAMQDESIARLREVPGGDVDVIDIDAGHMVMISQPAVLGAVLDEIGARTAAAT